ncbi:MAG: DUF4097 family beta strand repeat protein [Acidobacteria bacterium]|nr:DUF4097 family beta strand repeat protein [Acidobacteriota bacterium]
MMKSALIKQFARRITVMIGVAALVQPVGAQVINHYHRTLTVAMNDAVMLDVDVPKGELQIFYSHEGQLSVTASSQISSRAMQESDLEAAISIVQDGNRIRLRHVSPSPEDAGVGVLYRLDVPYRTAVTATIHEGKLAISGILGPVQATTDRGNITASYISKELVARAGSGDLEIQVIGAMVDASTGNGNISCSRAAQGVTAETQAGDITLMVVGPSSAIVKSGTGRINIGGARGALQGTTDAGDLRVKAVPYQDWHLRSVAGAVRIELPPSAKFNVEAASTSGEVAVERDDIPRADDHHHLSQSVRGGGPLMDARTESGRIVIQ